MGKGDQRSKRGKIDRGTFGKSRPKKKKSNWLGVTIGLLVSGGALAVMFYLLDFMKVIEALQTIDLGAMPLVMVFFFGTLLARSAAWRTILQDKISFSKSFVYVPYIKI